MTSKQYEELCRVYLADRLRLNDDDIRSVHIANPQRPNLPGFKHQIDLYWETEDEIALYLNIANAKWRGTEKVDQGELLLLHAVKEKVGAHKAVMITNTDFTSGAKAAAQHDGISLHIVRPEFDYTQLDPKDSSLIRMQLRQLSLSKPSNLYSSEIAFKAFDLEGQMLPNQPRHTNYQPRINPSFEHKAFGVSNSKPNNSPNQNWPPKFERK